MVAGGVDVEFELDGVDLRALLIRGEDAGRCAWDGEGSGKVGVVGMEDVEATRRGWIVRIGRYPFGAGCAFVAFGPHPAEFGSEAEGEIGGMEAVELEEDDWAGFCGAGAGSGRREHDLADGEGGVGVGDDGAVGADFNGGGLLVDVDGDAVALDVGFNCEVGEELDGDDPGFEDSVLLADEDAALTGHGEGFQGLGVGVDDGTGNVESDGGDGRKAGRAGLGGTRDGDCGNCGKKQGGGPAGEPECETGHCDVL